MALCLVGAGALGVAIYYAMQSSNGGSTPPVQRREDTLSGISGTFQMASGPGDPLDARVETHFWHPGYDPDESAQPTMQCQHRYPAISGGNLSYVMHKGWSKMNTDSPADDSWRTAPPEAAII